MGFVLACGYCETPLQGPANPNLGGLFKCPSCGQGQLDGLRSQLDAQARDQSGKAVFDPRLPLAHMA